MIPAVILCGGQATRLHPITESMPKALVEINKRPFLWHQLLYLWEQGVDDVVLCTGKFSDQIKEYVKNNNKFGGLNIQISEDGPTPLGTGGAIKKALPLLPNNFIVINGDTLFPINLHDELEDYKHSQRFVWMYTYNGIDAGTYFFHKYAFNDCRKESFGLWDLLNHMKKKKELFTVKCDTPYMDMGTPDGIKEMEEWLKIVE
jgi:NDP-sugar pyrophosphorylase family protein